MTYSKKIVHYNSQNVLVRSLHPLAYENNPSFVRVMNEVALPFKPYPEEFGPSAIEERQDLYLQIAREVWDPETIGLEVGAPPKEAKPVEGQAFYGVRLADLLQAGLISAGDVLVGTRHDQMYRITVTGDGNVTSDSGVEFDSLSSAAEALTGKATNGWEFWKIRSSGADRELARIREAYLEDSAKQSDTPQVDDDNGLLSS
jgi:hypothetical protein